MKVLRIVILLLAMLVLTIQTARHVYVRFIEPRTSVLDKYDFTDAKKVIQGAKSLSELIREYDPARKHVDELDKQMNMHISSQTKDEYDMYEKKWKEDHKKEYKRETELRKAITDWEGRSKEILELRVFWLFGFAFFMLGVIMLRNKNDWLGMSFLISGIVEMIWWTSPSFQLGSCPIEYDRLLNNKIGFTLATIIIILIAWYVNQHRDKLNSKYTISGE